RGDLHKLTAAAREAVSLLESEIANLRSLINDLRPSALDDADVETAIEALADRARRDGLEVDVAIDLDTAETERYSVELEPALYRIAQEALTNARKHGGAHRALIEIQAGDGCLYVTVRDDGHGFDPEAQSEGFGLHSMSERAEFLGGTLT